MNSQLQYLLSVIIEEQIAQILHFLVDIALPFEALCRRL